jgi:D-glycero-alpha-D-manno-heptose-7-phosphate kinase
LIIARTPVRVSFFGGGTDYPEYFLEHGGEVLATAIDRYAYITVNPRTSFFNESIRLSYSKTELVDSVDDLQHTAVAACLRYTGIDRNIEIHYISDLPARTGLGSSSSFVVCLLNALWAYRGKRVSCQELAYQAIEIEREILKENVGAQDQFLAAVGGFNHVEFRGMKDIRSRPVIIGADRLGELRGRLALFYTGLQRSAHEVAGEQIKRTAINVPYLGEMKALVREALAVLESDRDLGEFGKLLDETWKLKRSLSDKISNPEVDQIYENAIRAGATGGKLLGAGAGGFVLLYIEPEHGAAVRKAIGPLQEVNFQFEPTGSEIIYYQPPKGSQ